MGIRMGIRRGIPYPQMYPPPQAQIPTLADRSASRINPDLPSGLRPSGSHRSTSTPDSFFNNSVFPFRSLLTIMAFSQMDVVASLGALLRWNRFFLAVHVCAARRRPAKDGALSFAADFDEERGGLLRRDQFKICSRQF
jgi:hypothetical protein